MKSLIGFLLRLVVLVALAVWLADRPGSAHIVWHDYVIETSAAVLGLGALGIGLVFYLLFRLGHLIKHGPRSWRLQRKFKRHKHGQDLLTHGLIAIAGGNAAEAGRMAVGARKHLGVTPATQLLQAQAAQLAGDHNAAREIFRSLAAQPHTAVLGYRGLIMEARRAQDWAEVERLVEKLRDIKPKTPWLNLIRFELLARQGEWNEAFHALSNVTASRLLDPERGRQHRAALLVGLAQQEALEGHTDKALDAAEQAFRQAPGWLPAILTLARQQMNAGHPRAARRTIEKGWARAPHPQLIAVLRDRSEDPIETFKQTERLCRGHEDEPLSRLALAEAALAADIWGEARRNLIALIAHGQATQSTFRLMSRLERRESGDEQAALQWLTKAADAPPDPAWLCQACGGAHAEWQAACRHCGSFNTLEWLSPGMSRSKLSSTPLLPSWGD